MTFRFHRRVSFTLVTAAAFATCAAPSVARGQGAAHPSANKGAGAGIHDEAGIFKAETIKAVAKDLERIASSHHLPILVETFDSLHGRSAEDAAKENARRSNPLGVYILIDKKDRKFEMIVPPDVTATMPRSEQIKVRDAFLGRFKSSSFDEGLRDGIRAIETHLATLEPAVNRPTAVAPWPGLEPNGSGSNLVARNQVKLTLAGARAVVAGAEAKAAALGLKMNIAVVDDGGHLLNFARMDGARPASGYTALTKATTAATFRQETGPIPKGTTAPDPLLNLSLQNAATASGGKITTLLGGVPVVVDGQVIGGVGIGGGSGEQDAEVAKAGIARFLSELGATVKRDAAGSKEPEHKVAH